MKLFQDGPDKDVQEFWKAMEQSLGTPILGYALGRYISGRETEGPLWGLLYLTRDCLYFRHFEHRNWFSSMMQNSAGKSSGDAGVTMEIPLEASLDLEGDDLRGWRRLFRGGAADTHRLVDRSGAQPPFVFSVEQRETPLVRELRRVLEEQR